MLVGCFAVASLGIAAPLSAQRNVPTPESVFGFPVGADYKLFGYDQSIAYFRRLAAASDRIRLLQIGRTASGHPWTVALISSPRNLARLDRLRAINMRIAHPDGLTDSEARRLAAEGKPIVDISGGLHASEIAGSQHTPLLAYRLLSGADDPAIKEILDNVVLFLWPSINPDGQDIVVNWCRARDAGQHPPPMELYEKYIGHDDNRDAYMLNVVESRVIQRTWRAWEPDIVYVHHQSSPFPTRIWIPPFADPIGLHAPPIMSREVNAIGTRIAEELDAHGQPGAVHMLATYDAWYPGYIDYMPMYQNIPSWWTETQGGNCATPRTTTLDSLPPGYRDLRPTPLYVSPWGQGTWTLRDAVDYMVTASIATLRYAAKFHDEILYDRYLAGRHTIEKYRTSAPYAYLVPQPQYDPAAAVELLKRLAFMGIRIYQAGRDLAYDGTSYPRGTWVIPMDQEYAELVRELFEAQQYPDLGENSRPYDASGWTLPFQMNVAVVEGRLPLSADLRRDLRLVHGAPVDWRTAAGAPFNTNAEAAGIVPAAGRITGTTSGGPPALLLDPAQNNAFRLITQVLAAGGHAAFMPAGTAGRTGRYVVSGVDSATLEAWSARLALDAERVSPSSGAVPVGTRLALYKSAPGVIDEGWTEWLLDSYGFHYTLVTPNDLAAGDLAARFDVILLASQGITSQGQGITGQGQGRGGRAGTPLETAGPPPIPDSVRVRAFDDFVQHGGTLVAWNQGAANVIGALHLPVINVVQRVGRRDFFTGGSIMRAITDPTQPVMAGMPPLADVFVNNSPVFTTGDGFDGTVLARYPSDTTPLRSGYLLGAKYMEGFAAAADVRRVPGHVVLIAFQPQWRGQSTGTFRVVFNAALDGREMAASAQPKPDFWSAPPPVVTKAVPGR